MDRITCYNCFSPSAQPAGPCPHCGYDAAADAGKFPLALPPGSILGGRYILGRVLGQGGFGITYMAQDDQTKERVAIKEFFPETMATRTGSHGVTAFAGTRQENFLYGMQCFLSEAQTLAQFIGTQSIVRVHSYFEENGTAYFVMDYVDGISFQACLQQKGGRIGWETAAAILLPVMDALSIVHGKGIIHRDISPDNIYITRDGQVRLLDFGAARYSLGDRSRSLDVVLKAGYAPMEQYTRRGRQGPYTDVYSMAATFYFAITGHLPPESVERMEEDELVLPSSYGVHLPAELEDALEKALAVRSVDRYQTMEEFRAVLSDCSALPPEKILLEFLSTVTISAGAQADATGPHIREEADTSQEQADQDTEEQNASQETGQEEERKTDPIQEPDPDIPDIKTDAILDKIKDSLQKLLLFSQTRLSKFLTPDFWKNAWNNKNVRYGTMAAGAVLALCLLVRLCVPAVRFSQAGKAHAEERFEEAIAIYQELDTYRDSDVLIWQVQYDQALSLRDSGEFEQALDLFLELDSYEDSREQVKQTRYLYGIELLEQRDFLRAEEQLKPLGSYQDAENTFNDAYYQHGLTLLNQQRYTDAANVFNSLGSYSDAQTQARECIYQQGVSLREQGDHLAAFQVLKPLCADSLYKDSAKLLNDSALQHIDALVEQENYQRAIDLLKDDQPTPELEKKLEQLCSNYAKILYDNEQYEQSLTVFTTYHGYDKNATLYKDLQFQKGVSLLEGENYIAAAEKFEELGNHRGAAQKVKEAKYQYVLEKYELWRNSSNSAFAAFNKNVFESGTAAEYLDDLSKVSYKDTKKIEKEVYAWKIEFIAFNNSENSTVDMDTLSVYDRWYCHFKLTGGKPGAGVKLRYKATLPSGWRGSGSYQYELKRGSTNWIYWHYTNPQQGKAGTYTLEIYDDHNTLLGKYSVFISF